MISRCQANHELTLMRPLGDAAVASRQDCRGGKERGSVLSWSLEREKS
jgi:hypothetical protein